MPVSPTLKIAVTGPESTGKSELTRQLARHYKGNYVPEYAREYIENIAREYTYDDILTIARNQVRNEDEALKVAGFRYLFCDTELIVTRIWCLHKYGDCHPWIDEQVKTRKYDLYLLCNIDLPWEFDPQREHPQLRQFFFDWYHRELEMARLPYAVVSGRGESRLQNAINIIDNFFKAAY